MNCKNFFAYSSLESYIGTTATPNKSVVNVVMEKSKSAIELQHPSKLKEFEMDIAGHEAVCCSQAHIC